MLGAIFGDIVGSVYEFRNTNDYNFELLSDKSVPTDDSYMTPAVAKSLLENGGAGDEALKGAKAIAAAIFMARKGAGKDEIKGYIEGNFEYDLSRTLDEIRPNYRFYEICQKSCPEAIIAFLEGENYEDVIRKAVSLGGDSDTIACMAGGIAENDKTAMPVFTSSEMLHKVAGSCSTFSIFLDAYMEQVLEMNGVEGLLINPGERSFSLNRELMELILRDHKKEKAEPVYELAK